MSETIISMQGITKSYGKHQVLHDVNLDIQKGDIFGLIGRNGAGKTTLFKAILGLSDYKGKLTIAGSGNLSAGRRKIGFLVGSNFFGSMTARENLEYYRVMKGLKDKSEIDRVLKIVGLDTAKGPYSRFSMGMKQRLGIANAMLGGPEILILDEPTTGLDPQTRTNLWQVIGRLRREQGMTVFLTTHYMEEAADADYVVIIDRGRIAAEGTPLTLKNTYTGDFITLYGITEEQVKTLGASYESIRDAYRVFVKDTAAATELILRYPEIFRDYEITKGKMDDVFLAVTGKKLTGGEEK